MSASTAIKTWVERVLDGAQPNGAFARDAEIAELRAALKAAEQKLVQNDAQMLRMSQCAGEFAKDACKAQPDSERDAALIADADAVLAELAERCSSYDPERDYGGSMELRDKYRDGDYFKVAEVQSVIRAIAAQQDEARPPL